MKAIKQIKSFSFAFLFLILVFNLLNILFNLKFENLLLLNSHKLLQNYELWRIITYPTILDDYTFIFIFAPILLLISTKLENYLNKYLYPIFLFMVSILNSLLLTVTFWNNDINISGAETMGFFILTLATLLIPKENVLNKVNLNISTFSILLGIFWIITKYTSPDAKLIYSVAPLFGILTGFLMFLPLKNMKKYIENRENDLLRKQSQVKISIPEREELVTMRKFSSMSLSQIYHKYEEDYCSISDNDEENEEKLNQILDKIIEKGQDSLSHYEKKFLEEYSKRLK